MSKEDIEVINYKKDISEEYKINSLEVKSFEQKKLLKEPIKNIIYKNIIDDYIMICYVKIKNEIELGMSECKDVILNGFFITIIKSNSEEDKNPEMININIPIKKELKISIKKFQSHRYYFSDFITIDDSKNYLVVCLVEQMHIYRIYLKDSLLKYNKINMKAFDKKTNVLYLGSSLKSNILEIALLLKPKNKFYFISIFTNDGNKKLDEEEYSLDEKYNNILSKFKGSLCGKFIFTHKETNQKYIIYKKNNKINLKELLLNKIWENEKSAENKYYQIFSIENANYFIAELSEKINYVTFGIYEIYLNNGKNEYFDVNLIQKIQIKKEEGYEDYKKININSSNNLFICLGKNLYIIQLDKKGFVGIINKYILKTNKIELIHYEKIKDFCLFLNFNKEEIGISKFQDKILKLVKSGKCKLELKNENEQSQINTNYIIQNNENKEKEENKGQNIETKGKREKEISHKTNVGDKDEEDEEENEEDYESDMKKMISEIINNRMEKHKKNLEQLKKENDKKIKMIQEEIKYQNKEDEKMELKLSSILKRIKRLQNIIQNNSNDNGEKEELNNDKYNNINNNNYNIQNQSLNQNLYNLMNNNQIQYNSYRQMNQQQFINKLIHNNPQISINDPRIINMIQQIQQRNMKTQPNYLLQNNINNSINFHS